MARALKVGREKLRQYYRERYARMDPVRKAALLARRMARYYASRVLKGDIEHVPAESAPMLWCRDCGAENIPDGTIRCKCGSTKLVPY